MANYGTYASLTTLKAALGIATADTTDDTRLLGILEDASRFIDEHCGRHFQPRTETRVYTPTDYCRLLLDSDLLAVTSIKHDDDGDLDYDYTWDADDYLLRPANAWPKTEIITRPIGEYTFPTGVVDGLQIAGLWGYGDGSGATPYVDSTTTTAEALDTSETGVDVVSGAALAVGQCILVESEQMYVTATATNTATVVRGVNGTTAAAHDTGKTIYAYRYPSSIRRACVRIAERTYMLEKAPLGVQGSAEMGTIPVQQAVDTETLHWLAPFRRLVVA